MQDHQSSGRTVMTPSRALILCWVMWAALLMVQASFFAEIMLIDSVGDDASELGPQLFYIAMGLLVVIVPVGYFVRGQVYKRNWQGNRIAPQGYLTGNVVLWACCESVGFCGLTGVLVSGSFWPNILPTAVAVTAQLVNYPHGRPMGPADNPYQASASR